MFRANTTFALVVGLAAGLLSACPTEPEPDGLVENPGGTFGGFDLSCEPGEELPCTCFNGAAGVQVCLDDGNSAGGCTCAPLPDPTAASTTLPPGMMPDDDTTDDSGSDSESGSSESGSSGTSGSSSGSSGGRDSSTGTGSGSGSSSTG